MNAEVGAAPPCDAGERDVLAWLEALQADFADALRTPCDASSGTLVARAPAPAGVSPGPGIAAYQRQYWFRLFTAMQGEFPLTARVLGLWSFNQLAQEFLLAHPPRGVDLHDVGDGFADFLSARRTLPRAAVLRAASRVDEAWRAVLSAPEVHAWRPQSGDAASLAAVRLRAAPTWRVVRDRFSLVPLRRVLADDPGEGRCAVPPAGAPRDWLILRTRAGTVEAPLDPVEARLYAALCRAPLAEALAAVDARCDAPSRARLASEVRGWLAQSIEWEMWLDATEVR
jgi:hypothetical protein